MMSPHNLSAKYLTSYRNLAPGSTGVVVKASQAELWNLIVSNTDTNNVYLKLYNKATAATSSDTPIHSIAIIKGTSVVLDLSDPIYFSTGLSIRVVQGQADNDTTAPTAATCTVNLGYK